MSEFRKMMSKSTRTAKFGMVVIVLWVLCHSFINRIGAHAKIALHRELREDLPPLRGKRYAPLDLIMAFQL